MPKNAYVTDLPSIQEDVYVTDLPSVQKDIYITDRPSIGESIDPDILSAQIWEKNYKETFPNYDDFLSHFGKTPEKKSYEDETWSKWGQDLKDFSLPTTDDLKEKW